MRRHSIICRFGGLDNTTVNPEPDSHQTTLQFVAAQNRFDYGLGDVLAQLQHLGIFPTETSFDLLALASAVYCADTRISRSSESQDSWTREVDIYLPVHDPQLWASLTPLLTNALKFLTGDKWRIFFRPRPRRFVRIVGNRMQRLQDIPTSVCLFSGGLDSFIGAIDLLENGQGPLLVSHGWIANVSHHQTLCFEALQREYGVTRVRRIRARIGFKNAIIRGTDSEKTERSRSFLFFALAAFAASGFSEPTTIYVPENGLISLNVPLDPLRLGSLSTRTTHPYFIARINELLSVLEIAAQIENPYRHKTKGQMVRECQNQIFLAANVVTTMSCSSPTKGRWTGNRPGHCGYCGPCLIRRASLHTWCHGDPTRYAVSNLYQRVFDSTRAEGESIRSFQLAYERLHNSLDRAKVFIQKAGPLSEFPNEIATFARVYLEGMQEVAQLLNGVQTRPNG
jgi:hypothetical protein